MKAPKHAQMPAKSQTTAFTKERPAKGTSASMAGLAGSSSIRRRQDGASIMHLHELAAIGGRAPGKVRKQCASAPAMV